MVVAHISGGAALILSGFGAAQGAEVAGAGLLSGLRALGGVTEAGIGLNIIVIGTAQDLSSPDSPIQDVPVTQLGQLLYGTGLGKEVDAVVTMPMNLSYLEWLQYGLEQTQPYFQNNSNE